MLIVLVIIIVNLLYKVIKKDVKKVNRKLYTIEEDELFFLGTKINIDNNTLEILKMLQENEQITSNDIVAKLVDNGLSYDYASKVKNKVIESLNERSVSQISDMLKALFRLWYIRHQFYLLLFHKNSTCKRSLFIKNLRQGCQVFIVWHKVIKYSRVKLFVNIVDKLSLLLK